MDRAGKYRIQWLDFMNTIIQLRVVYCGKFIENCSFRKKSDPWT
jgi:hypothetical protein